MLSWLEALAAAACAADSSSCRLLTAVSKDAFSACIQQMATAASCQVARAQFWKVCGDTLAALAPAPETIPLPAAHSLTCSASTCLLRSSASSLQACTCDSSWATRWASTALLLPVSAAAAAAARRAWLASRSCCRADSAAACAAASLDSSRWT